MKLNNPFPSYCEKHDRFVGVKAWSPTGFTLDCGCTDFIKTYRETERNESERMTKGVRGGVMSHDDEQRIVEAITNDKVN